ncbi:hypothetical protein D3C87_1580940 [compost metagenome]
MQAEKTGNTLFLCLDPGRDRAAGDLERVGNQRRQKRRRAEFCVCGADRGDAFDGRLFIEKHPAAAIHL